MRESFFTVIRFSFILIGIAFGTNSAFAQVAGAPPGNLAVSVDLVLLDVSVHDKDGEPVNSLAASDFLVYEDKVEQSIASATKEEEPVSWGLVLDRSGSMGAMIREVYESAVHILEEGTSDDEMFITTFGDRVDLVSPFTSNRRGLQDSIFGLAAHGPTP